MVFVIEHKLYPSSGPLLSDVMVDPLNGSLSSASQSNRALSLNGIPIAIIDRANSQSVGSTSFAAPGSSGPYLQQSKDPSSTEVQQSAGPSRDLQGSKSQSSISWADRVGGQSTPSSSSKKMALAFIPPSLIDGVTHVPISQSIGDEGENNGRIA